MIIIRHKLEAFDTGRRQVGLGVDRHALQKTRWRGVADDGTDFGFDLEVPLKHDEVFFETDSAVFVIRQAAEPVLVVGSDISWRNAAELAWSAGNLHQPIELRADGMRLADEPAVRAMLEKLKLSYTRAVAVFRPQRGSQHAHDHHHKEHHAYH